MNAPPVEPDALRSAIQVSETYHFEGDIRAMEQHLRALNGLNKPTVGLAQLNLPGGLVDGVFQSGKVYPELGARSVFLRSVLKRTT